MLSDIHSTRNSLLCALLCALGPTVLGCSADDPGVSPKPNDAGASTGGASSTGAAGNFSDTTTGASGSGMAGSLGTGGAIGSGGDNGGMSGAGGAGGQDCTTDSDGDGTPDCMDECQFDKAKTKGGLCGCGNVDNASGDVTGDGGIDCVPGMYYEAEKGTLSGSDAGASTDGGASGPWTIGNDAMAAGGQYILSPAGLDDGLPGAAHVSYTLNIPADGMYTIWARIYSPSLDHNRIWFRTDNAVWQKMLSTSGEAWFWFQLHKDNQWDMPISFQLTKGMHTLEITNDTDGLKIDRFYVTSQADRPKAMTGDDTTCNPPHTVAIGGVCRQSCGMLGGTSCDPVACGGKPLLAAYDCAVCCNATASDAGAD